MKKILSTLMLCCAMTASAQHTFSIDTKKSVADVKPTMYGIFFEDINYGADGGLYAELVANRSFEFPQSLMCWNTFGRVTTAHALPAFERCPNYVTVMPSGHPEKRSGLENRGYFGIGLREGMEYKFRVFARLSQLNAKEARLRVEIVDEKNNVIDAQKIKVTHNRWTEYTATLKSPRTVEKGIMRVFLDKGEAVDLDHVSLMPADNWNGMRADLVKALQGLHPGIFRFPGGCIVEGTDLTTRYEWKKTVGAVENRPLNENRWNYTFAHRMSPNYFQTYGIGFYEYFLLSEKIGAEPLPVLSVGLACQYQNSDDDPNAHVALKDLQPYIDDALDLIEFANGDTTTTWGRLRKEMGHPAPFNLKQIGIGNEQWGPMYPERLEAFMKQMRRLHPEIMVCGSSGPSAEGDKFDYGWEQMRRLGVDLVDEHYYKSPEWFLSNASRYDKYPRKGPKVFAGEYAAHGKGARNNWQAALAEACFMTGLERNADVVWQATYAPLFAHVDGWQWKPDLIWFNNTESVRSANWYVQMLYGTNPGTNVIRLTEDGKPVAGQDSLYASAVKDMKDKTVIVKIGNAGAKEQNVTLNLSGIKRLAEAEATVLTAPSLASENSLENKNVVAPVTSKLSVSGTSVTVTVKPYSFNVLRLK